MLCVDVQPSAGAEARRLVATAAARHGPWLIETAGLVDQFLWLRSAAAPGLWFVGATAAITTDDAPPFRIAAGGSGLSPEDALAACLGEAIERTSQRERPGDLVADMQAEVAWPDQCVELAGLARLPIEALAVDVVRAATPVRQGQAAWLPADWCLRRAPPGLLALPGAALSTGCAAGLDLQDAITRGTLELIERDAAALWWIGGAPATEVGPQSPCAQAGLRVLADLRQDSGQRSTRLLDITSDLAVPVRAAVSFEADGRGFACGLAARFSPEEAAKAAILELGQMELGLELARSKARQLPPTRLTPEDRRHLLRAAAVGPEHIDVRVHPASHEAGHASRRIEATLEGLMRTLADRDLACLAVDLSRPDLPLAVAKVVVPRLQQLPCDIATGRLERARGAVCQGSMPAPLL